MNTKSVLSCAAVAAAITLSASVAMAAGHGGSGGGGGGSGRGGFSGGGFRGGSGPASARMGPGFARSRFGNTGHFRGDFRRHRRFDNDDFFFFGGFGDPFFYPFGYGYYPYGYYPYGYYPPPEYGYGYGYGAYGQAGYQVSAVVNIQRRLARAGYYHGRIDGVMGPRTREAMRAYQQSHNRRVGAASGENRGQKSDVTGQRKTMAWGS